MYKMSYYSPYGHELKLERMIPVETYAEAVALAEEKIKVYLGCELMRVKRISVGKYTIFAYNDLAGELVLVKL